MPRSKVCSVDGCDSPSIRSVSIEKFKGVDLKVNPVGRRIYLCKEHNKIYKKARAKIERYERMRWRI